MAALVPEDLDSLWEEGLRRGKRIRFRVGSGSMSPLIDPGDHIVVESCAHWRELYTGDILLLRIDDTWIVHRLIHRQPGCKACFLQKGDAGGLSSVVVAGDIAGRVIAIEKPGRRIELRGRRQAAINRLLGGFFYLLDILRRRPGRHPLAGRLATIIGHWLSRLSILAMKGGDRGDD